MVDNGGGGIFSFLPQADLPEHFETLFGTPQAVDLAALAAVHGIPIVEVGDAGDVAPAVRDSVAAGGVRVVLVRTDRATQRRPATARSGPRSRIHCVRTSGAVTRATQ